MFKCAYEVISIDFMDGTILLGNYIDSIIADLSWYKEDLSENINIYIDEEVEDDIEVNLYMNLFEEEHMGVSIYFID